MAGDGGFQMTIQELATIVQEKVAVKVAIINNGYLGMVRQRQRVRRYKLEAISSFGITHWN